MHSDTPLDRPPITEMLETFNAHTLVHVVNFLKEVRAMPSPTKITLFASVLPNIANYQEGYDVRQTNQLIA